MIGSIPCHTILNNIVLGEIDTHDKNNNLVFAQVSMQCPFKCATNILGERKQNLVSHTRCCWLCIILTWPILLESSIPWVTRVRGINVAFSTLVFTMHSTTLFLINPHFFIWPCGCVAFYNYCCEFPH
jgi:hypothetical protein